MNPLALVVLAFYICLSINYLLGRRSSGQALPQREGLEHLVLATTLLLHAPLAFGPLAAGEIPRFGAKEGILLLAWLSAALYWTAGFFYKLEGMQGIVLPLASLSLLVSLFLPSGHPVLHFSSVLFKIHFIIAMLSYGFLAMAAGLAVLMLMAHRQLHEHRRFTVFGQLPPLLSLEKLLFYAITTGFVLLTFTLFSGVLFSEAIFGHGVTLSHKTVFAILSWIVFGALLAGHHWYGWRGKLAANWTLGGFSLLLLAYIGSRFVLEVILGRI
ncbi:cytochrome C assembly family protein [Parachitinimonas caeni]|uniref:Cytochrome c biogenesis protein CcsA n=1 Tax=Parachitinimonas caeni TaxID=3031301 RepID=A0ABT7DVL6_9NEIS|nr:cytochrome c biogenesis protein CcsA [Parachitinimonas caeni]MDK2124034.1 cytochrome c biogenesis protein CcsA [Parachitinimonas caeni]